MTDAQEDTIERCWDLPPKSDPRTQEETVDYLAALAASTLAEWDKCGYDEKLLKALNSVPISKIHIDNALCLGLGSLHTALFDDETEVDNETKIEDEIKIEGETGIDDEPEVKYRSMFQLLVLEKVLEHLRKQAHWTVFMQLLFAYAYL